MLRATRAVLTLAAVSAAIAALMSVPAMAAGNGTLTSAEFRQLSTAMAALDKSATAKSIDWTKTRAACRSIGGSTALLRAQRASCLASMGSLQALASFPAEAARCTKAATGTTTGTTTTGTTTTPAVSSVMRTIICLSPRYQALGRYARALYRSDIAARRQALLRGFKGTCLATLGSTPADLRKEKLFASSTTRLDHDVVVLIKVTKGQVPTTDLNQVQIDTDVSKFQTSAQAVLDENGPQKLSACPHQ